MRFLSLLSFALWAPLSAQAAWTQLYTPTSPPPQEASMACFEPTGDVVMMFGITNGTLQSGWKLQSSTWSAFPVPVPGTYGGGLVYDSTRQRLVAFAGYPGPTDDVYEWNGAQWVHPLPAVRPGARSAFAIAFDRVRGVTVLFGGVGTSANYLTDLWEWNGVVWTQRSATTPLGPRAYSKMAFDPVHGQILVYGGMTPFAGGTTVLNDTWGWNGTSWTHFTPSTPPPYNVQGAITTDLHRQRVVLYGGTTGDPITREWDGSEWTSHGLSTPGARINNALAYDTSLRRTVLFGGSWSGNWIQDTWIYRTPLPATVVAFGAGCAGTAGTPVLAAKPFVLPWLGDTMRNVVQTLPAASLGAFFVSSFGSTPPLSLAAFGMPGCDLLVPVDVAEFRVANAGRAEWELVIPNTPSLAAAQFLQQAFVMDAAANALGLVASNGVMVTLGVR